MPSQQDNIPCGDNDSSVAETVISISPNENNVILKELLGSPTEKPLNETSNNIIQSNINAGDTTTLCIKQENGHFLYVETHVNPQQGDNKSSNVVWRPEPDKQGALAVEVANSVRNDTSGNEIDQELNMSCESITEKETLKELVHNDSVEEKHEVKVEFLEEVSHEKQNSSNWVSEPGEKSEKGTTQESYESLLRKECHELLKRISPVEQDNKETHSTSENVQSDNNLIQNGSAGKHDIKDNVNTRLNTWNRADTEVLSTMNAKASSISHKRMGIILKCNLCGTFFASDRDLERHLTNCTAQTNQGTQEIQAHYVLPAERLVVSNTSGSSGGKEKGKLGVIDGNVMTSSADDSGSKRYVQNNTNSNLHRPVNPLQLY